MADCVIALDHRVDAQVATRRLRIVKYRGSSHGTSEYPFLIDDHGISVVPISSLGLTHDAVDERVSSGVPAIDVVLGGHGFYRGASVLVTGTAGTGKSSLACHFAQAAAARGERCLWFAFEESPAQIQRDMRAIGIDLAGALRDDLLRIHADRPTVFGLERHLVTIHRLVTEFDPHVVIVDPISNFSALGTPAEIHDLLVRLIDFFKSRHVTALFTCLTSGGAPLESTEVGVSSLMDTWILLRDVECGAERNRVLHVLKSRGMAHSNQVREFVITARGIELRDVYAGPSGELVLGSARMVHEAQEHAEAVARNAGVGSRRRALERRRRALEARIQALRAEFEEEHAEAALELAEDEARVAEIEREAARRLASREAAQAAPVSTAARGVAAPPASQLAGLTSSAADPRGTTEVIA